MITAVPRWRELLYFQLSVSNETYSSTYAVG